MSNKAPLLDIDPVKWLQVFRGITNATNERTFLTAGVPWSGVGNSAPVVEYGQARAVASALVLANMNSLPFDWAARFSVGGVNMNFFIVKQLPVLPPEAYLEHAPEAASISAPGIPGAPAAAPVASSAASEAPAIDPGGSAATPDAVPPAGSGAATYVEVIVPRVLELVYTADDMRGFAEDIGYDGPPFTWDDSRRHLLRSELDAIYSLMYGLERGELEWILDAPSPSASFPALKRNERKHFGEYRTRRLVLSAYDRLTSGQSRMLTQEHRRYRLKPAAPKAEP